MPYAASPRGSARPRPPSSRPPPGSASATATLLREEIAATLDEPDEAEVEDEVRDLFAALGR